MTEAEGEATARTGAVEPAVAAEFPGLELRFTIVPAVPPNSPPELRARLGELSDRFGGARVVAMRTQAVAHAYRAFYRQVGLDPDVTRVPSEAAAVQRLLHGGFRSRDRISDALLVALLETGVPVWGLDAGSVDPATLGIRATLAGECLGRGEGAVPLGPGRLVIADQVRIHAALFGEFAPGSGPDGRSREIVLVSVGVPGVPSIHLEEALWLSIELLGVQHRNPG